MVNFRKNRFYRKHVKKLLSSRRNEKDSLVLTSEGKRTAVRIELGARKRICLLPQFHPG